MPSLVALAALPALLLRVITGSAKRETQIDGKAAVVYAPLSCCVVAAQCLSALTDSNAAISARLLGEHSDQLGALLALITTATPTAAASDPLRLLRVLAANVLQNIAVAILTDDSAGEEASALETQAKELKDDVDRLAPRVLVRTLVDVDLSKLAAAKVGPALETLQITLEVLGELCAGLDGLLVEPEPDEVDDVMDEDDEWGGIDGDESEPAVNGDVEMSSSVGRSHAPPTLSLSADSRTLLASLPSTLIALARPVAAVAATDPSGLIATAKVSTEDASVRSLVESVRVRALECLNNLLVTLARTPAGSDAAELALPADAQKVWEGLFEVVLGMAAPSAAGDDEERQRGLEAGLGAVWALARGWIDRLVRRALDGVVDLADGRQRRGAVPARAAQDQRRRRHADAQHRRLGLSRDAAVRHRRGERGALGRRRSYADRADDRHGSARARHGGRDAHSTRDPGRRRRRRHLLGRGPRLRRARLPPARLPVAAQRARALPARTGAPLLFLGSADAPDKEDRQAQATRAPRERRRRRRQPHRLHPLPSRPARLDACTS